jgi:hypothetical protein
MNPAKLIFVLFNLSMVGYFVYGFLFPKESNFWLINTGFKILLLELATVFVVILFLVFSKKIKQSGRITRLACVILLVIFFVSSFFIAGIVWFLYFVASCITKVLVIIKTKEGSVEETIEANKILGYPLAAFVFSALIASVFAPVSKQAGLVIFGSLYFLFLIIFELQLIHGLRSIQNKLLVATKAIRKR